VRACVRACVRAIEPACVPRECLRVGVWAAQILLRFEPSKPSYNYHVVGLDVHAHVHEHRHQKLPTPDGCQRP
jgi:hypothetical protein